MPSYRFVVLSNSTPGMEEEYNTWYTEKHLGELLAIPGFISAQRFKIHSESLLPGVKPSHNYLAIYEIETDDIGAVLKDLRSRPGTPAMPISDAFDRKTMSSLIYEVITPLVRSED